MSKSQSSAFELVRRQKGCFTVHHFAGPVVYCSDQFVEKNRDFLGAEVLGCLKESENTVLQQQLCSNERTFGTQVCPSSGRVLRAKAHSVSSDFRDQLQSLMKKIEATRSRFVRCIKPNESGLVTQRLAREFDGFSVLEQLRYQGVIEAIRVARAGYALRLSHQQAVETYWMLASGKLRCQLKLQIRCEMYRQAAEALFSYLKDKFADLHTSAIQIGKTLTFFRADAMEALSIHIRRGRERSALEIQTCWRGFRCAHRFRATRKAALVLQSCRRGLTARKIAAGFRREHAILTLQRIERGRQVRQAYLACRQAALTLQAWKRGHHHRLRFLRIVKATLRLQHWIRWRFVAPAMAKTQSMTRQRLSHVRNMVQDTLVRLTELDLDAMDESDLCGVMASLEKSSKMLCRQAEVLERCQDSDPPFKELSKQQIPSTSSLALTHATLDKWNDSFLFHENSMSSLPSEVEHALPSATVGKLRASSGVFRDDSEELSIPEMQARAAGVACCEKPLGDGFPFPLWLEGCCATGCRPFYCKQGAMLERESSELVTSEDSKEIEVHRGSPKRITKLPSPETETWM